MVNITSFKLAESDDPLFSDGFKIFSINGSYGSARIIRPKNKSSKGDIKVTKDDSKEGKSSKESKKQTWVQSVIPFPD